jgi:hypothetical protein
MSFWSESPVLRGAVYALGCVALIAFGYSKSQRNAQGAAADDPAQKLSETAMVQTQEQPSSNEHMILGLCHPEPSPNNSSPPNFDVSNSPKPFALSLKVRFWVNGNGFVTRAYAVRGNFNDAENQEAAVHYIKGLIFQVPATDECQAREMELNGEFHESSDGGGQWTTTLEMHPRYIAQNGRVVERP